MNTIILTSFWKLSFNIAIIEMADLNFNLMSGMGFIQYLSSAQPQEKLKTKLQI